MQREIPSNYELVHHSCDCVSPPQKNYETKSMCILIEPIERVACQRSCVRMVTVS